MGKVAANLTIGEKGKRCVIDRQKNPPGYSP